MRNSTLLLGGLFLLMAACAALFLTGGTLSPRVSAVSADAADYPDAFKSIRGVLASGAAPQRFADVVPADASACRLEDVTIELRNRGLFAAEWLSVEAEGARGDIAVYSLTGEGSSIPARSVGSINLKIISAASGGGERAYRITYYVYGLKRVITVRQ